MSRKAPDWARLRSQPAPYVPRSARPRAGNGGDRAPLAGAPGWYVVRRKPQTVALLDRLPQRRRRLALLAVAATGGLVALAALLLGPYWGEAGMDRSARISRPPVASSPDRGPDEPATASADAPPVSQAPAQVAREDAPRGQRDGSGTEATRAKRDPAPPQDAAAVESPSREGLIAFTPQVQSRAGAIAAAEQSQSPVGDHQSRVQLPEPASEQTPSFSPPPAAGPEDTAPKASQLLGGADSSRDPAVKTAPNTTAQMTGALSSDISSAPPTLPARPKEAAEASASADRPAPPVGKIRVFIHHTAGRAGDAALAQRLADHLRKQGFTVADIRPVDFSIGKASVRYFFEDDRSASERLVADFGRFLQQAGARAPDQASDFTHFMPKPRPGNVEVWLRAS
jgi:hypothetical protein